MSFIETRTISRSAIERAINAKLQASETAESLGISRATLYRRAKTMGLGFADRRARSRRSRKIMALISAGVNTSTAIAHELRTTRNVMSVDLYKMSECGLIERAGSVVPKKGRPSITWRVCAKAARHA